MPDEKPEGIEVAEEEASLVKDILRTFSKTSKAFAVYPKDNPVYIRFADELEEKFGSFFEKHETLNLDVSQFSLNYGDKEVFYSEERQGNMALQMYVDGIRQISFHKGITHEEIAEFVNIMRVAPTEDNLEDDVVTLLWEKDLEHISHFVPEEVAEDEAALEEALAEAEKSESFESAGGAKGGGGFEAGTLSLGIRLSPSSPEMLEALKLEAGLLEGEGLIETAVDFFMERMSEEDDPSAISDYSKQIAKLFDLMMEHKDVTGALSILRKTNEFLKSAANPEVIGAASGILSGAGTYENLNALIKNTADLNIINDYLSLLNKDAATGMINVLGETENRKLRRQLCNVLVPFAKEDIGIFSAAIKDQKWFLIRNIVMILGMSGEPSAVPIIAKTIQHNDMRVRREAARALDNIQSPDVRKPLMSLILDPDSGVRIIALRALRKIGGQELFLHILEHMKMEKFKERSLDEKKEFLEAFGETGKENAFPMLSSIFKKSALFQRDKNIEMKAAAAYGLGRIGSPQAVELLKKGLDSKNNVLKTACVNALKGAGKK